jgi:DME family drug/metabolite transporter
MHVSATRPASGLAFLVTAGTLWGTGGLTGSLLAHHTGLSAPAIAAYRLGAGGLLLVVFLLVTRRPLPRARRAWARIAVVGLLAAGFQASYFAAVARVSVSLATLLTIGAAPVLVILADTIAARRRAAAASKPATAARWVAAPSTSAAAARWVAAPSTSVAAVSGATVPAIGTVAPAGAARTVPADVRTPTSATVVTAGLAVAGLVLLVGVPSGGRSVAAMLSGGGFALLAAAGFATLTLVGARPVEALDDLSATGLGFTLGSTVLVPLAAAGGGLGFRPGPAALGLLLLLGAGPTAIAYAAYFRGLRTASPDTAALMALLEPLVGTALSVVVLGDRLAPAGVAGAVSLIVALVLAARRGR